MAGKDKELEGFEEEKGSGDDKKETQREQGSKDSPKEPDKEAKKAEGDKELEGFVEAKGGIVTTSETAAQTGAQMGTPSAPPRPSVDVYTEVTEVREPKFGEKLSSSVQGVFIGFILFLASFFILYKGGTRIDRSEIIKAAKPIQPDDSAKSAEGQSVKFTGKATTTAPVTDPLYLPEDKFLYLSRSVEMYAWVEKTETKTEPGSSPDTKKEIKTYRYVKEWTSSPEDSSGFKHPEGHINPSMVAGSQKWFANPVTVGSLTVDLSAARIMGAEDITEPPPPKPLDPNAPEGSGAVSLTGTPSAAKPLETQAAQGKKLLVYAIVKETYDGSGKWVPGATTLKVAEGVAVGKVKIDPANLKTEDMPQLGKMLFKPGSAETAPAAGNERATVRGIEIGAPVTFSGTLAGDTLSSVTVSAKAGAGPGEAKGKSRWYIGKGAPSAPEVGDVRLSFAGIRPDANLFVCGKLQGGAVGPTNYKGVLLLLAGRVTEDQAIAALQSEHRMWTWIARIGGFLCMWIGMCMMAGPLTFLLRYIPVLGELAGGMLNFVFCVIALILTILTILLVRFFWVILLIAAVVVFLAIRRSMQAKGAAAKQPS
ncbi:MAG: TMEM43 family protein [Planctomycetota bacterium]